jgi:hypothetical protein
MKRGRKPNAGEVAAGAAVVTAVVAEDTEDTEDGVVAAGVAGIGEIAETAGRKSAKFGVAENRGRRQYWQGCICILPFYYR